MSIRHAILGFLSWKPFTGYELKRRFADALSFHWSGNSNQIYGALIDLGHEGSVSVEVQPQEKLPARKVYTVTDRGSGELRAWILAEPELPLLRSLMHTRLAWADCLTDGELENLLSAYERKLSDQILMYRETMRRGADSPARNPREILIWKSIEEHTVSFYERERNWIQDLRKALAGPGGRE